MITDETKNAIEDLLKKNNKEMGEICSYYCHVFDISGNKKVPIWTAYAEPNNDGTWQASIDMEDTEHVMNIDYESYDDAIYDIIDWANGQ